MHSRLNRREFLVRGAVGGAALSALPRAAGAWGRDAFAPNDRIQVGIVGVGARVHSGLLQAALAAPGVEVVGVCDAYKGRVERAIARTGGRARDYGDWRRLLEDAGVDAVVISTPDHLHRAQTLAALAAGKDVYLEKPMTFSIDEGAEMIAAARKGGRILQVGSQGMSSRTQEAAREMIAAGRLGRVTLIRATYNRNTRSGAWLYPIPPDADDKTVDWQAFLGGAPKRPFSLERFFRWRCYWDYSGGIATDLFVHLLTTIHFLMDAKMPARVVALGTNYRYRDTHEVPDTLNAVLEYPEGFSVSLSSTFNNQAASESGFEILGNEGSLVFRGGQMVFRPENVQEGNDWIVASWPEALERAYYEDPQVRAAERPETWEPRVLSAGESYQELGRSATAVHVERFFESVRSRTPPTQDGEAGHRAAAAAHMVNESVRRGHVLEWDFAKGATRAA